MGSVGRLCINHSTTTPGERPAVPGYILPKVSTRRVSRRRKRHPSASPAVFGIFIHFRRRLVMCPRLAHPLTYSTDGAAR